MVTRLVILSYLLFTKSGKIILIGVSETKEGNTVKFHRKNVTFATNSYRRIVPM